MLGYLLFCLVDLSDEFLTVKHCFFILLLFIIIVLLLLHGILKVTSTLTKELGSRVIDRAQIISGDLKTSRCRIHMLRTYDLLIVHHRALHIWHILWTLHCTCNLARLFYELLEITSIIKLRRIVTITDVFFVTINIVIALLVSVMLVLGGK